MKINIIGCGFAGLATALFLGKNHQVTIFEKFPTPSAVGAGILLQPSSQEILNRLDILDEAVANSEKIYHLSGINHKKKKVFATYYDDYKKESYGLGLHRSVLFDLLYQKCQQNPNIRFSFGTPMSLNLANQSDLLIVASGTHSEIRQSLPIEQSYRIYPYGCLWTTIEDEQNIQGHLQQYVRHSQEMFGLLPSGKKDNKRLLSVFWSLPITMKDSYKKEDIVRAMQDHHDDKLLIDKIKLAPLNFATYADVWMKQYHHRNIVVIGDAAHGMSPQLGQGANMAFLDAYCLSQAISNNNNLDIALSQYTKQRKDHLRFYSQASRFLTPLFQSDSKMMGLFRDYIFATSQYLSLSRKLSSHILCGKKTSWLFNKEIKY